MDDFLRIAASPKTPRSYHRRIMRRIAAALQSRPPRPEPRLSVDFVMVDTRGTA